MSFLSAFIAIVGAPNVGKSTLLNRITATKLSIVTPKPQTTRNRIIGVCHGQDFQMVFIDTPGIHKPETALHRSMVDSALAALQEVDMVLMMVEAGHPPASLLAPFVLEKLKEIKKKSIAVINKIDLIQKEELLPVMEFLKQSYTFDAVIPVSALNGEGVDDLLDELKQGLQPGPRFFPEEMVTDQSEAFLTAEVIREKIYYNTRQEIPYSSAVTVKDIQEKPKKNLLYISAGIHVETDSQKKVLIGKNGRMIKSIGRAARLELEKVFCRRIFLDLSVRVEKNWGKDPRALRRLGY